MLSEFKQILKETIPSWPHLDCEACNLFYGIFVVVFSSFLSYFSSFFQLSPA